LAGARELGRIYVGPPLAPQNYVLTSADRTRIVSALNPPQLQNTAGGQAITMLDADVRIGQWNPQTRSLTVTTTTPDAVEVTARRDATANGPLPTFFAQVMGVNSLNVSATATAALTSLASVPSKTLGFPIGISKYWFAAMGNYCGKAIKFNPTGNLAGCAGWNSFTDNPPSDSRLRDILSGLQNGTYVTPEVIAGKTQFNFIGGDLSNPTFDAFTSLFNAKKAADGTWKTVAVIYDRNDCSNPQGAITIVGVATVMVTKVDVQKKTIDAQVICEEVKPGRGSGGGYGIKGSIPGLVQ
jgi:hypothetical protein